VRWRPILKTLGEEVRDRRLERKLTQEELAQAAGIDVNTLRRLELAQSECQILTLVDVAMGLSMPLAELIAGVEQATQQQVFELTGISTL
jgi:transcriptional regulator with XRE-family HTH domain